MLSQVVKVVDPQVDFRPVKYSDKEKLELPDAAVILKFFAEDAKKAKTGRDPKMRPKLVLKITRKTS